MGSEGGFKKVLDLIKEHFRTFVNQIISLRIKYSGTFFSCHSLLEMAAGYSSKVSQFHTSTPRKRQMFVRACVKLVLSSISRHKQLVTVCPDEIRAAVRRMVDKVETVINASKCFNGINILLTPVYTKLPIFCVPLSCII